MATLVAIRIATQVVIRIAARVAAWYATGVAILHRNPGSPHTESVDKKVEQELAEVGAIALRIVRRNAANKVDEDEIRERLPGLRAQDVGPADLERAIHGVFVAGTISRWTRTTPRPIGARRPSRRLLTFPARDEAAPGPPEGLANRGHSSHPGVRRHQPARDHVHDEPRPMLGPDQRRERRAPPAAGDLVLLEVRRPAVVLAGPTGWVAADGNRIFWKIIGPPGSEPLPTFHADCADGWEVQGYAIAGDQVRLPDGSGSAVERTP